MLDLRPLARHSHVLAAVLPNCVSYDPTYSYEIAVIIVGALRRMLADQEGVEPVGQVFGAAV
jgi:pyruvate dehydrogenase complex dehydrogenase (E1) component